VKAKGFYVLLYKSLNTTILHSAPLHERKWVKGKGFHVLLYVEADATFSHSYNKCMNLDRWKQFVYLKAINQRKRYSNLAFNPFSWTAFAMLLEILIHYHLAFTPLFMNENE